MDLSGARWRKSSFSTSDTDTDSCVEMAFLADDTIALRDTKDRTLAAHIHTRAEWHNFLSGVRAGDFTNS